MAYASFQGRAEALEIAWVAAMASASVVDEDKSSARVVVAADTEECSSVDTQNKILLDQAEAEAATRVIVVAAAFVLACTRKVPVARSATTGRIPHVLETAPRQRLELRYISQRAAARWGCAKQVSFDCDPRSLPQPMVLEAGQGLGMRSPAASSSLLQHQLTVRRAAGGGYSPWTGMPALGITGML